MVSTNLDTQGVTADVLYPQNISPSFCCGHPHSLPANLGSVSSSPFLRQPQHRTRAGQDQEVTEQGRAHQGPAMGVSGIKISRKSRQPFP